MGTYWAVAQTVPNQEGRVAERMKEGRMPGRSRFTPFIPLCEERRRVRKRTVVMASGARIPGGWRYEDVNVPLFSGYVIFMTGGPWWNLRECEGVVRVILSGDTPVVLPTWWVEQMQDDQRRCGHVVKTPPKFVSGQRVYVKTEGHNMYGVEGTFRCLTKRSRIQVLFMMLGQAVLTEMDERDLAAA